MFRRLTLIATALSILAALVVTDVAPSVVRAFEVRVLAAQRVADRPYFTEFPKPARVTTVGRAAGAPIMAADRLSGVYAITRSVISQVTNAGTLIDAHYPYGQNYLGRMEAAVGNAIPGSGLELLLCTGLQP